ncbi:MAG TPA: type VI secretion system amidase immunity protein Tai4 [Telluria sp.]
MTVLPASVLILALAVPTHAESSKPESPSAAGRRDASNFKDMVLSICISRSYQDNVEVSGDAASTARALIEWTRYDAEKAPDEIEHLVAAYLQRDYSNPIADDAKRTSRFNLLKCLDLYHSAELERLTRRVVPTPQNRHK